MVIDQLVCWLLIFFYNHVWKRHFVSYLYPYPVLPSMETFVLRSDNSKPLVIVFRLFKYILHFPNGIFGGITYFATLILLFSFLCHSGEIGLGTFDAISANRKSLAISCFVKTRKLFISKTKLYGGGAQVILHVNSISNYNWRKLYIFLLFWYTLSNAIQL